MRRKERPGTVMLFWIGLGVLCSSVAVNIFYTLQMADAKQMYESFCSGWQRASESRIYAGLRVIPVRALQTFVVFKACRCRLRQMGVRLLLLVEGMSAGALLVMMSRVRGLFAIVPFLMSGFPHIFCYFAAWGLYLYAGLEELPDWQVRQAKVRIVTAVLVVAGMFLEICTAPRMVVKFL